MKLSSRFLVGVLFLSSLACGVAAEVPPAIQELLAQIRAELKIEAKPSHPELGDRSWQLSSTLLQIENALKEDELGASLPLKQLLSWVQSSGASEKMQRLAEALVRKVEGEFSTREKATVAAIEKLVESNVNLALNATTPAELDGPLAALAKVHQRDSYENNRAVQDARRQAGDAKQFVTGWQDYLAAKEAGNIDRARGALASLTSSGREYSFMPRSKLLALATTLDKAASGATYEGPVARVVATIKTLDDLPSAMEQLSRTRVTPTESTLYSAVRSLADALAQIKAGQVASFRLAPPEPPVRDTLAHVREALFALALPRILGVDEEALPAKAGETGSAYLRRALDEARQKKDWPLASRILQTSRSLNLLQTMAATEDYIALTQFLTGLNQEKARQFSLAVVSFQFALKTGSDFIPPELIGEHLDRIRQAQPKDFEMGMEIMLKSPPPAAPEASPAAQTRDVSILMPGGRVDSRTFTTGPDGARKPVGPPTVNVPAKAAPTFAPKRD